MGDPQNALAPACVVPVSWMLRIQGRVGAVKRQDARRCVLMCHTPRKEYYKKFLYEAFPVESHLDHALADHLNAEIVSRNVTSQQAAMDFLTWTFYYRRLAQNPNYYNMPVRQPVRVDGEVFKNEKGEALE